MATMGKIRVIIDLSKGFDEYKYLSGESCYLQEALSKRLKKGFTVIVFGWGTFTIRNAAGNSVFNGTCPDFDIAVARKAGAKKRKIARFVDVPVALFKRTRCKELVSQA